MTIKVSRNLTSASSVLSIYWIVCIDLGESNQGGKMQSYLADIDELVLKCRDDEARKYIGEAVASYKAGAFRACIVMTWIAVVYDFLYKLRELELSGDKHA